MPRKGYMCLNVPQAVYERIKEEADKRGSTISSLAEQVILENLETQELMKEYGPFLSYVDNSENTIFINDWRLQRIAAVRIQEKQDGSVSLFCELDQSENCVHVGFVFALPKFYKILKEKGIKPRSIR